MQMRWLPKETTKNASWSLSFLLLIMLVFHGMAMADVTIIQTGKNGDRHRELGPTGSPGSPEITIESMSCKRL